MIRVVYIVGQLLNKLEEVGDEAVVDVQQVVVAQALDARHLVHELEEEAVEAGVLVLAAVEELEQAREAALVDHGAEGGLVAAAVEHQEAGDGVQRGRVVLLQQAVDDLRPHVVRVRAEEAALQEPLRAVRHHGVLRRRGLAAGAQLRRDR